MPSLRNIPRRLACSGGRYAPLCVRMSVAVHSRDVEYTYLFMVTPVFSATSWKSLYNASFDRTGLRGLHSGLDTSNSDETRQT